MSSFRVVWDQVRRQLPQLAFAVLVMAIGVALASAILFANAALAKSFHASIEAMIGRADLEISPYSGRVFSESVLDAVAAEKRIEAAAPILLGTAFLDAAAPRQVRIVGVDMLSEGTVRLYRSATGQRIGIDDPLIFLNQPGSVLLPNALARDLGVGLGDSLPIRTSEAVGEVTVRGLIRQSGVGGAFGGSLMIMDLYAAQDLLKLPGKLSRIDLVIQNGLDPVAVGTALRRVIPASLQIAQPQEQNALLARSVRAFQLMLDAIGTMALVVAVLITGNRLFTIYQERIWEIGVLRALGLSPADILRDLLAEATLTACLAVVLGVPTGFVLAHWIVEPVASSMSLNFRTLFSAPAVAFDVWAATMAALAGIIGGVAAAVIPARRAVQLSIQSVLSKSRRRDAWDESGLKKWARVVVPAIAALLLSAQVAFDFNWGAIPALVCIVAGSCLLLTPTLRAISPLLGRMSGAAGWVGVADQSKVPSRSIGAATVLLVGGSLAIWIGSIGTSFEEFVVDSMMRTRRGDLIVDSKYNELAAWIDGHPPRIARKAVEEIASLPGVEAVGSSTMVESRDPALGILAVDPLRFRLARFGTWDLDDDALPDALERVAEGLAFLANRRFMETYQVAIGDPFEFVTPTGSLTLQLAGAATTSFLSNQGDVVISRDIYRQHWDDDGITRTYLLLNGERPAATLAAEIEGRFEGPYGIRVTSPSDLSSWLASNVSRGFAFADAMALLTLVVVAIGTADALGANVLERTREIASMRALGLTPGDMRGMILVQALGIGVAGGILAVLCGATLTLVFVDGILQPVLGWDLEVHVFSGGSPLITAAVGVLACLVGASIPAERAARLSPAEGLRYE